VLPPRTLEVPELSLVVLVGASGSGKSTFAQTRFLPTEIVSSDVCRALVADDERDQNANPAAFELVHFIAAKRMERGRLTVVDATNVRPEHRAPLVALAHAYHFAPVAIVFDLPQRVCLQRNRVRPGRRVDARVVVRQSRELRGSLAGFGDEGFRHVHVLRSVEETEDAIVLRAPFVSDRA
jgi:protein phosphatase